MIVYRILPAIKSKIKEYFFLRFCFYLNFAYKYIIRLESGNFLIVKN